MNDFGYFDFILKNMEMVNATQGDNIRQATELMDGAIKNDRLISAYGGGGYTTLP